MTFTRRCTYCFLVQDVAETFRRSWEIATKVFYAPVKNREVSPSESSLRPYL